MTLICFQYEKLFKTLQSINIRCNVLIGFLAFNRVLSIEKRCVTRFSHEWILAGFGKRKKWKNARDGERKRNRKKEREIEVRSWGVVKRSIEIWVPLMCVSSSLIVIRFEADQQLVSHRFVLIHTMLSNTRNSYVYNTLFFSVECEPIWWQYFLYIFFFCGENKVMMGWSLL